MHRAVEPPGLLRCEAGLVLQRGQQKPVAGLQSGAASERCPCPPLVPNQSLLQTGLFLLLLASVPTPIVFDSTTENVLSCQWPGVGFGSQASTSHRAGCFPSTDSMYSQAPSQH